MLNIEEIKAHHEKALNGSAADISKFIGIDAEALIVEVDRLNKRLDSEKCALLQACEFISDEIVCCEEPAFYCCKGCETDEDCVLHLMNYFRQQAQEATHET